MTKPDADVFITDVHPEGYANGWRTGFSNRGESLDIRASSHPIRNLREVFTSIGFDVLGLIEPRLGEPERPIFEQTGKTHLFEQVRGTPAVVICHLKARPQAPWPA